MSNPAALQRVHQTGVVAILRASSGERLVDVAEALLAGGVEVVEVTFSVPAAHRVLEKIADRLGDKLLLGAGSVLDPETARIAMLSGAEFIVAPTVNLDVIEICRRYAKPIMPGAMTPTEVLTAWQAGADIIKLFPSEITGPKLIKAIHGPLPQIPLMPTGGVNQETAGEFIRAGACALGMGSTLAPKDAIMNGDLKRIESLGRQFIEIVKKTRKEIAAEK
ncbi:MAG: bifunctional 4-hydroxy-2-oxoglutarate aldolase/2-dehydro-3-deoxy-phosphogluconate aldolase [Pirellulales bacterium]|nr:bifunctional 4-hydroxy-2-oxoglutarate aldolase/2-dehydro-3-deoxy-phosphogluconate aldolase [Pirellulales bacterium]